MKKVSVIIPVYNVEDFLEECVQSVLSQKKFDDYEIILVDDGSTDKSGEICDRYASEYPAVSVFHKPNGGLSDARNYGLNEASGEYIVFLDSDDFLSETALCDTVPVIEKVNCDFVFFDALSFNDEGRDYTIKQNYKRKNDYPVSDGLSVLLKQLRNKEYHSQVCLMMFSGDFLKSNRLTFLNGILYEDMLFSFQAYCSAQKVAQIKKALYHRRYRTGSIVTSKVTDKNFSSSVTVFKESCKFSCNNNLLNNPAVTLYLAKCAYNAMDIFKRMEKNEQSERISDYEEIKALCKERSYFGDKALKMRCKGKIFWYIYKVFTKLFKVK